MDAENLRKFDRAIRRLENNERFIKSKLELHEKDWRNIGEALHRFEATLLRNIDENICVNWSNEFMPSNLEMFQPQIEKLNLKWIQHYLVSVAIDLIHQDHEMLVSVYLIKNGIRQSQIMSYCRIMRTMSIDAQLDLEEEKIELRLRCA